MVPFGSLQLIEALKRFDLILRYHEKNEKELQATENGTGWKRHWYKNDAREMKNGTEYKNDASENGNGTYCRN